MSRMVSRMARLACCTFMITSIYFSQSGCAERIRVRSAGGGDGIMISCRCGTYSGLPLSSGVPRLKVGRDNPPTLQSAPLNIGARLGKGVVSRF
jgi:hypothetical protein